MSAKKRDEFLSEFERAVGCMHRGAEARVGSGDRDEHGIGHTIINACGQELYERLRNDGVSEDDAVGLLDTMTVEAIRTARTAAQTAAAEPPGPAEPRIEYDAQKARDRDIFLQLDGRTTQCMREGAVAQLRQGARERSQILEWTSHVCARPLFLFMTGQLHRPAKEVDAYLNALAGQALNAALRGTDSISVH